jgi:hypothetical protein
LLACTQENKCIEGITIDILCIDFFSRYGMVYLNGDCGKKIAKNSSEVKWQKRSLRTRRENESEG